MHVLPQSYVIVGQEGIKDPIGMSGVRLEAKVHIVTGATSAIQDIVKSVNRVGLDIDSLVLEQLAAGESWDSLLHGYPELTRADVRAVLDYARHSVLHTEIDAFNPA